MNIRAFLIFLIGFAAGLATLAWYPDAVRVTYRLCESWRGEESSLTEAENEELIAMLNSALADEWFAFYQYWIGARVAQGPKLSKAVEELEEHAREEYEHAVDLAVRIKQLGGTPLLDPKEWRKKSTCGYEAPRDFDVKAILEQNIKGEHCAVKVYNKILTFVKDKDSRTAGIIKRIIADEEKHIVDLEALLKAM